MTAGGRQTRQIGRGSRPRSADLPAAYAAQTRAPALKANVCIMIYLETTGK